MTGKTVIVIPVDPRPESGVHSEFSLCAFGGLSFVEPTDGRDFTVLCTEIGNTWKPCDHREMVCFVASAKNCRV